VKKNKKKKLYTVIYNIYNIIYKNFSEKKTVHSNIKYIEKSRPQVYNGPNDIISITQSLKP